MVSAILAEKPCACDLPAEEEAFTPEANDAAHSDGLSDVGNPYLFTGRRLDPETGLMQYRHRYYSSVLGRFVSRDPLGYADGLNRFGYARGRATAGWDPSGTTTVVEVGNPKLPYYFTAQPGNVPMVVTGTYWLVYGQSGKAIFGEGRAGASLLAGSRCGSSAGSPCGGVPSRGPQPVGGSWLRGDGLNAYPLGRGRPGATMDPFGVVPGIPDPSDILKALGKCVVKFGVDLFFRWLDITGLQACNVLSQRCRSEGKPPCQFPWNWPAPDIEWANFGDFVKCMVNEGIVGFPIFDDETHVQWYRDVFLNWTCINNPQEQAVYVALRGRLTVVVNNVRFVAWAHLLTYKCEHHVYCQCCG